MGLLINLTVLKKALMKEVKALFPGERVFFLGTTSNPQVKINK